MDYTPQFFGLGMIIGIVLFFVCERMGWLHKWSGLKDPRKAATAKSDVEKAHEQI